jgi:hypothetical protein
MRRKKRRKVRGGRKEIVEGKIIKKRWKIKKKIEEFYHIHKTVQRKRK